MDILGRSPPFSIPFQSGVGEGDNLGNRRAPSVCLCPLRRGKNSNALYSAQYHQAVLAQDPGWRVGRESVCRSSPGNLVGVLRGKNGPRGHSCCGPYALFPGCMLGFVSSPRLLSLSVALKFL